MPEIRQYNLPWIEEATRCIGIHESTSSGTPKILGWARDLGKKAAYYTNDDIPWCGLFVAHCFKAADIEPDVDNILWALDWNTFGDKTDPCYGAVMVFGRSGGGHVGFYVSEDDSTFHILGGNQSDAVNITRVAKDRLVGSRWPSELLHLKVPGRIKRQFDGKISTNEA